MSCTEETTRSSLEQLASKKFGRLTEAETRMVHAAAFRVGRPTAARKTEGRMHRRMHPRMQVVGEMKERYEPIL